MCALRKPCCRVTTTATTYFKRFYLRNNFCVIDPRLVYVGCLYLASKAEESLIQAKHLVMYVKKLRPSWAYDVKHLLEIEMVCVWCHAKCLALCHSILHAGNTVI